MSTIMELASSVTFENAPPLQWRGIPCEEPSPSQTTSRRKIRLGIARDEAFHFYYADNLESLADAGAEWVPFSPLRDACLPADLDGLYLGGGYPEAHAARLADNREMLADVRQFAASGRAIYAECGGLMYLGRTLTCLDGARYAMAGVLPLETTMLEKLKVLGYAEVAWAGGSLWGAAGQVARGHEFHYSEITAEPRPADGWLPAYMVRRPRAEPTCGGFFRERVLAGYVHLHWASRPEAIDHFLCCCEQRT
jgi:cobyrinic acid a,c-diamide synthase